MSEEELLQNLQVKKQECKDRAYLYALSTGAITFAGFYFASKIIANRFKHSKPSIVIGDYLVRHKGPLW